MKFKPLFLIFIALIISKFSFANDHADSAIVVVSFIVNKEGQKEKIKIHNVVCANCEDSFKQQIKEEALNVIKKSPDYLPQKKKKKYLQPVKFKIKK